MFGELVLQELSVLTLSLLRLAPIFIASSLSPFARFPMLIRILTMGIVGLLALQFNNVHFMELNNLTAWQLVKVMTSEVLLGLAFAFGLQSAMAALLTIGRVVDMQVGFGAAGILDPNTNSSESIVGMIVLMMISLLFFTLNIHHDLISFLTYSFKFVPLGSSIFDVDFSIIVSTLSAHFFIALLALLPVIMTIFLVDVVIAFSAKTMPQMNIYFVGLPLKIGVGIITLAGSVKHFMPSVERLFEQTKQSWQTVIS